jgi:hypothetical protein
MCWSSRRFVGPVHVSSPKRSRPRRRGRCVGCTPRRSSRSAPPARRELLLTTGWAWWGPARAVAPLCRLAHRRRRRGPVSGAGPTSSRRRGAGREARERGLTVIEFGAVVPFVAITEAVHELLLSEGALGPAGRWAGRPAAALVAGRRIAGGSWWWGIEESLSCPVRVRDLRFPRGGGFLGRCLAPGWRDVVRRRRCRRPGLEDRGGRRLHHGPSSPDAGCADPGRRPMAPTRPARCEPVLDVHWLMS